MHIKLEKGESKAIKIERDVSKVIIETHESKMVLNPVEAQHLAVIILNKLEENGWILETTADEIHALFFPEGDVGEVHGEATEP